MTQILDASPITLRPATEEDRTPVIQVEARTMPNWRYLPQVFDLFMADAGEFSVAEVDGEVVACGKFTPMVDGSAWLETLRVVPDFQGRGIGKRLYERFFEQARAAGIPVMRMYTGVENAVSKGLAERFGFRLAGTCGNASRPCRVEEVPHPLPPFRLITDPAEAAALIMPHAGAWGGFLVMNRTWYAFTPALCAALARQAQVYADAESGSLLVAGSRFMPEQALHIGLFAGDPERCFAFAMHLAAVRNAARLSCLFPARNGEIAATLLANGFQRSPGDLIVMEGRLVSTEEDKPERIPGLHQGMGWMSDDFDDPLPGGF